MTRSKAIARLRGERQEAGRHLNADRAAWCRARRDSARSLQQRFVAEHDERRRHRYVEIERLCLQLDGFAVAQVESRIAQDGERAAHMEMLVKTVNDMISGFLAAGTARKEDAVALSDRVTEFLLACRSMRIETNAEQAARLHAFRTKLTEDVYQACTADFQ